MTPEETQSLREQLAQAEINFALEHDDKVELEQKLAAMEDKYLVERGMRRLNSGEAESLRQQLAAAQAEIKRLDNGWKEANRAALEADLALAASQVREVMLREALLTCSVGDFSTGHVIYPSFDENMVEEALAATSDLDGLILCHAKPVAFIEKITSRLAPPEDNHYKQFWMCYESLYRARRPE